MIAREVPAVLVEDVAFFQLLSIFRMIAVLRASVFLWMEGFGDRLILRRFVGCRGGWHATPCLISNFSTLSEYDIETVFM